MGKEIVSRKTSDATSRVYLTGNGKLLRMLEGDCERIGAELSKIIWRQSGLRWNHK